MSNIHLKPIKEGKKWHLNQDIGFGWIWGKIDFLVKRDLSWCRKEINHSKLLRSQCNAYKVELLGEYSVNVMFSISNLWLFDIADDSRANPLEERRNDVILASILKDPL
jgi:hypothetical protein